MRERRSAIIIQRAWRGHVTRRYVEHLRCARPPPAAALQGAPQAGNCDGQRLAGGRPPCRRCATDVQRVWRGHVGRKRFESFRAQKQRDEERVS